MNARPLLISVSSAPKNHQHSPKNTSNPNPQLKCVICSCVNTDFHRNFFSHARNGLINRSKTGKVFADVKLEPYEIEESSQESLKLNDEVILTDYGVSNDDGERWVTGLLCFSTFVLCSLDRDALAAGGEFGILEGTSFALIHPIVMSGLFLYTLYAGYLGWQWRRVRTVQDEINELKKQVKPVAVTPDGQPAVSASSPVETKIQELTQERKELIKGSYRDKHFNAGSILLGFGVLESIYGGTNTWLRTGKLFPGPHLFAGAAITILWAAAASLVPPMQKGNETARNLHIALNVLNLLLFIWQIPTGIEIVLKVFEFTKWP